MFQLLAVILEYGVMDLNHPFSYAYLGEQTILKGMRVKIPLRGSLIVGFVIEEPTIINSTLEEYNSTASFEVKQIDEIIDSQPILNSSLLDLAKEVSSYYFCPLIDILKTMLPPSLRPDTSFASKPKRAFLDYYVVNKDYSPDGLTPNEDKLYKKFTLKPEGFMKSEITSKAAFNSLLAKGAIVLSKVEKLRLPQIDTLLDENHQLNEEQEKAYEEINSSTDKVFLLQGVTGSGKTEIYIKLIQDNLLKGNGAIILVPEISLTDMMISRFKGIFGDHVALIHSGLTDSQKYDEYIRIARGDALIVVGARSAIFAPVKNLDLIIIDEEHVESYKQDTSPFYDARKVALMRNEKEGGKVIFGSATPSLACRARADKGIYHLVRLNNRFNNISLPTTEIVDLLDYSNVDYNSSIISIPLRDKIRECLDNHKQTILLLNRRGYAPYYICRKCQKVLKCPNCNLPLTYHKTDHQIMCHHCDYVLEEKDLVCPKCGGTDFIYQGFGTERIVDEIKTLFPDAKVVRFDADSVRQKGKYHQILADFSAGKYDIMVGTQMVAKGHDFPNVSLAASLLADQSLEFPSYKANEDTFDLLTQLAGRAGRKDNSGEAVIQTYTKDSQVINLACKQDYEEFYKFEMANRQARQYPPFTFLINIIVSGKDREALINASYKIRGYLIANIIKPKCRADLYGPTVPYIEKKANRYYRMFMIKYKSRELIAEALSGLNVLELGTSDIRIAIDVDPSSDIM